MSNNNILTHTRVVFFIKDEPVLDSIQKEFKGKNYVLECNDSGKFTRVQLSIDTIIEVLPEDNIMLDGYETQFESLTHY